MRVDGARGLRMTCRLLWGGRRGGRPLARGERSKERVYRAKWTRGSPSPLAQRHPPRRRFPPPPLPVTELPLCRYSGSFLDGRFRDREGALARQETELFCPH